MRRLLVAGEAAARLTEETRAQFPEIPFHKIIGMRNRVVHDYGQVDFEIVWETVEHHLPMLMKELQTFFVERGEDLIQRAKSYLRRLRQCGCAVFAGDTPSVSFVDQEQVGFHFNSESYRLRLAAMEIGTEKIEFPDDREIGNR